MVADFSENKFHSPYPQHQNFNETVRLIPQQIDSELETMKEEELTKPEMLLGSRRQEEALDRLVAG